jgi:hypothetical protein
MTDINKYVGDYVAVRDKIREKEAAHKEELKPLKDVLDKLSGILSKALADTNSGSIRTDAGTCYKTVRWSASLPDADAFMRFVIATNSFDLMDRKANATAVREYVAEHNAPPPGVNLTSIELVGVKRGKDTPDD